MTRAKRHVRMTGALWLLVKRGLVLLAVIAVCASVPLLVRSHQATSGAVEDPPTMFKQLEPADPGPAVETRPTDESVRELAAAVSGHGDKGYDVPVSAAVGKVRTVPGPYRKLGRIQIPAIGLDTGYGEGVYAETLDRGPGHWPGTPMPGSAGNSVLSGHRNTHTQPFKEIDELRHGDAILVSLGDESTTYRVVKTTIVSEAKFKDFVLRQPQESNAREITVFACHPEGNPVFRIVVQATAEPLK